MFEIGSIHSVIDVNNYGDMEFFEFHWYGGQTVNVWLNGNEVDVYSIETPSTDEFIASVHRRVEELNEPNQ